MKRGEFATPPTVIGWEIWVMLGLSLHCNLHLVLKLSNDLTRRATLLTPHPFGTDTKGRNISNDRAWIRMKAFCQDTSKIFPVKTKQKNEHVEDHNLAAGSVPKIL